MDRRPPRQQTLQLRSKTNCTRMLGGKPFDYPWEYCSVIGKLNFLEKSTRGDLTYSVHQCARFMSQPMKSHGEAVKCIGQYLLISKGRESYFDLIQPSLSIVMLTPITVGTGTL
jgi:hypothetical protein